MGRKFKDVTGQKFGMVEFLEREPIIVDGVEKTRWKCKCHGCDTIFIVKDSCAFTCGRNVSCGCYQKTRPGANTRHGFCGTKTYTAWISMKNRCYNPEDIGYHRYGGRGITVCERWLESFENFLEDMGECPDGLSLDRKDSNLGYCKDNCRWSDWTTQCNNRRNNVMVEFNGKSQSIADWCRELGLHYNRTRRRISSGWTIEKAFTYPHRYDLL